MTTKVPANMVAAADVATQAELDAEASARALGESGDVLQVVDSRSVAVATGTTVLPADDTIPQNTEGDEYLTRAITPAATGNKLRIDVVLHLAASVAGTLTAALFQDATAGALAAGCQHVGAGDQVRCVTFTHYMNAGTVSETTFKVRAGLSTAGTTTLNGADATRMLGGVLCSSITITEVKA
jgi:hypothetical protein